MRAECSLPKLEMIQIELVKRGHETAKPLEMHCFSGDFCTCANCRLETQIGLISLKRAKFHVNF